MEAQTRPLSLWGVWNMDRTNAEATPATLAGQTTVLNYNHKFDGFNNGFNNTIGMVRNAKDGSSFFFCMGCDTTIKGSYPFCVMKMNRHSCPRRRNG
jgi:hypothetical protein